MSSLVQSIFGDVLSGKKKKKNNEALTSLFHKPATSSADKSTVDKEEKSGSKEGSEAKEDASDSSSDGDSASGEDKSSSSSSTSSEKEEKHTEKESGKNTAISNAVPPKENAKQENDRDEKAKTEEEEMRTVFVGNLPLSMTRKSLAKLFKDCGKIQSTRLRSVAVAGVKLPQEMAGNQHMVKKVCTNTKQLDVDAKASLQGYVVFVDEGSIEKALQLNNTPIQDENPKATRAVRRIRVDYAKPTLDPKRSVFVGNLPYQAEEASLQDHFVQGCGLEMTDIEGVRIVRDKDTFQCKGIGYVLFRDATMVATALQKMHESVYMSRPLRVKVCSKSTKGKLREAKRKLDQDGSPNKKQRKSFDGKQAVATGGAMKRLAQKEKKRARGEKKKKKGNQPGLKPGISRRAASEVKTTKRVKKLQKRISKGMGKARK